MLENITVKRLMSSADAALKLLRLKPSVSHFPKSKIRLQTVIFSDAPSVNVSISKTGPLLENEDDVRLSCDVDANPQPEIAWLKSTPGQVIDIDNDISVSVCV